MNASAEASSEYSPLVLGCGPRCRRLAGLAFLAIWAFGLGATAAEGLVWLSPLGEPLGAALWAKLALAVALGGGLLCYAGLSSRSEMHFETERRLVREVLRRPGGRVEQVASWGFDEFRATEIRDRHDARRMALRAELRLSGENLSVRVAEGDLPATSELARRIEVDLGQPQRPGLPLFRRAAMT